MSSDATNLTSLESEKAKAIAKVEERLVSKVKELELELEEKEMTSQSEMTDAA